MWTPVDAMSQRHMVPGNCNPTGTPGSSDIRNLNGAYAYKKIIKMDETKGLYSGFGISIITYVPSNMAWWASYSVAWC
ncbi:hypothetical protein Nepgr_019423 [Nepenthes gracilis]|uniref:Uncharacterized protein n=1 Tax=Nepenthes gracilis TaxID=150966 RepID=A0AAD3SVW5_NEPGR|nr:hypothetical protein Nepgr_019423 [Nepenthes gracilis]